MKSKLLPMLLFMVPCSIWLAGCGGSSNSCVEAATLAVTPVTASATAGADAPRNQVQYAAESGIRIVSGNGCVVPAIVALVHPVWTASDPMNVTIDSSNSTANGLATCLHATSAPVTLTATFGSGTQAATATASLMCQ